MRNFPNFSYILSSHPKANGALRLLYDKIELTGEICWKVDDELRRLLEVFSLWEKQGFLKGQHAIGNSWISIRLTDPVSIMSVFSAVRGDRTTLELRRTGLNIVKQEGKWVHGESIAESQEISLVVYIDALFQIFESEGKGWKSKTIGSSSFSHDPAIC